MARLKALEHGALSRVFMRQATIPLEMNSMPRPDEVLCVVLAHCTLWTALLMRRLSSWAARNDPATARLHWSPAV